MTVERTYAGHVTRYELRDGAALVCALIENSFPPGTGHAARLPIRCACGEVITGRPERPYPPVLGALADGHRMGRMWHGQSPGRVAPAA